MSPTLLAEKSPRPPARTPARNARKYPLIWGRGQAQRGSGQPVAVDLARAVVAGGQLGDAAGVDVEPDGRKLLRERHRQGQPDIAQAYNHDVGRFTHLHIPML